MAQTEHMEQINIDALQQELEHFKKEKEKIRKIVGAIGGQGTSKRDKIFNYSIIFATIIVFCIAFSHYVFHLNVHFPPTFYIELGMLFISLKIIWMVHNQAKVNHFQFWILNSIEFRLNGIAKKLQKLEKERSNK